MSATNLLDVRQVHDETQAILNVVKVAKCGLEVRNAVAEVTIRAEYKGGNMLHRIVPHEGGRPRKHSHYVSVLDKYGIYPWESSRWQLEATVPEALLERHFKDTKDAGKELTGAGVLRLAMSLRAKPAAVESPELMLELSLSDLPVTQLGDLWDCGRHRLLCGDATKLSDVVRLMDGKLADSLVTDPPYGVDYADKNEFLNEYDNGKRIETPIVADAEICDYRKFYATFLSNARLREPNTVYVCQAGKHLHEFRLALDDADYTFSQYLVWVKNNHVLGRTDYHSKNEFVVYAWKGRHQFHGGFRTTVLEYDRPKSSQLHPTMKPLRLIEQIIIDGSAPRADL